MPPVADHLLGGGKGSAAVLLAGVVGFTGILNWWFNEQAERRLGGHMDQIRRERTVEVSDLHDRLDSLRRALENLAESNDNQNRAMWSAILERVTRSERLEMKDDLENRIGRLENRVERLEGRIR